MFCTKERRRRVGVTLIEIVCAFLIFTVATLGALGIISFGHRGTQKDLRMLAALDILSDRMNRMMLLSYASMTALITSEPTIFTNDGGSGMSVCGIPYGLATYTRAGSFNVDFTISHQSLTFGLQPFNIVNSIDYSPASPSTFAFDDFKPAYCVCNGTQNHPYKLIKYIASVKWKEPNGVDRSVQAVSFVADLGGS